MINNLETEKYIRLLNDDLKFAVDECKGDNIEIGMSIQFINNVLQHDRISVYRFLTLLGQHLI